MALRHKDFTMNYQGDELGKTFRELNEIYRDISNQYGKDHTELEAQYQLIQLIIDRMDLGIIAVAESNELLIMNKPAERLLNISGLRNWQSIEAEHGEFGQEVNAISNEGNMFTAC